MALKKEDLGRIALAKSDEGMSDEEKRFRMTFLADVEKAWLATLKEVKEVICPGWRKGDDIPEVCKLASVRSEDFEGRYWGFVYKNYGLR